MIKHIQNQIKGVALILFGILLIIIAVATRDLFLSLWLLGVFAGLACGVIGMYLVFSEKSEWHSLCLNCDKERI